jgi:hypothetical protein
MSSGELLGKRRAEAAPSCRSGWEEGNWIKAGAIPFALVLYGAEYEDLGPENVDGNDGETSNDNATSPREGDTSEVHRPQFSQRAAASAPRKWVLTAAPPLPLPMGRNKIAPATTKKGGC